MARGNQWTISQEFERELHSLFAAAEAEVVGHEVERFDIDLPFVTVDGIVHQRVLRCEDTYFCASRSGAGDAELVFDSQGVREGDLSDGAASRDWWKGVGHRMRRNKRRGSYLT